MIWRRTPASRPSGGGAEAWKTVRRIESMNAFSGRRCRSGAVSGVEVEEAGATAGAAGAAAASLDSDSEGQLAIGG